jgi:peroxiredoxin
MARTDIPTLAGQIAAFQQNLSGHLAPEIVSALGAESARIIASGSAAGALKEGQQAPDFALPNATGQTVQLATLLEQGPVIVTFYRGDWCPYCNLALRAYQAALPEITALGATLVAISPQTPDNSLTTAEKKGLSFPVLSDVGNRVARHYGLVFALSEAVRPVYAAIGSDLPTYNGDTSWELPVPGTFVIAPDGRVRLAFVDPDYTRRLEPSEILAALRTLTGVARG